MSAIKERTLRFRVDEAEDNKLRAAAILTGETLTEFTLRPALARADEVLAGAPMRLLGEDEYAAMIAALAQPVTPIPALAQMAQEPRLYTTA